MTTKQAHRESSGTARVRYPLLASLVAQILTGGEAALDCSFTGPRIMRGPETIRTEVIIPSRVSTGSGNAGPGRASRISGLTIDTNGMYGRDICPCRAVGLVTRREGAAKVERERPSKSRAVVCDMKQSVGGRLHWSEYTNRTGDVKW